MHSVTLTDNSYLLKVKNFGGQFIIIYKTNEEKEHSDNDTTKEGILQCLKEILLVKAPRQMTFQQIVTTSFELTWKTLLGTVSYIH